MADLQYVEDFQELQRALTEFYHGEYSFVPGALPPDQYAKFANAAGYHAYVDANGNLAGYRKPLRLRLLESPSGLSAAEKINSNVQSGTAASSNTVAVEVPVTTSLNESGEVVTEVNKVTKFTNGVKGLLNTPISGTVGPAIAAASAGIALGKAIDGAIYHLGNAFGLNPPESLDPATWASITADMSDQGLEGLEKWGFNFIFGINDDGSVQAYMDQDALAYWARYAQQEGWFNTGANVTNAGDVNGVPIPAGIPVYMGTASDGYGDVSDRGHTLYLDGTVGSTADNNAIRIGSDTQGLNIRYTFYTSPSHTMTQLLIASAENPSGNTFTLAHVTDKNKWSSNGVMSVTRTNIDNKQVSAGTINAFQSSPAGVALAEDIGYLTLGWYLIYGSISKSTAVDGVSTIDGATLPDLSTSPDQKTALQTLQQTYPDLWNNRVEQTVVQPDGSVRTITYVPVGMPTGGEGLSPTTTGASQTQTQVKPDTATNSQVATLIKVITDSLTKPQEQTQTKPDTLNPYTNPPGTGEGDTPEVPPPTGQASSLYAIYNPTLAELNNFGAWLWSADFIDQIKKLFNDPMQAIIGLHKIYATPATSGKQNIKVGYLDSGCPANVVAEQYTTINCGTVNCAEYFGNVFDYSPYTSIELYLPFIGIVSLDNADVMRSSISVVYHVDVLTGACLAEVKVQRDNAGGTLYQYAGNAAVQLPISAGSYIGVLANVAGVASSIAGGFASGGALGAVAGGIIGTVSHTGGVNIEHSGSFSGNAGAMGGKIPYLIISRPQMQLADNYQDYVGNPSNATVSLGSCSGWVQVKEVHLESISATGGELRAIENMLKGGVLI